MTIEQDEIELIYNDIVINETRELILKIFLGNKVPLTRAEVIEVLEIFYHQKHEERKTYPRTTVYDNMTALQNKGVLKKYAIPNPIGRGRPLVKWEIDDEEMAKALLKEAIRRNS